MSSFFEFSAAVWLYPGEAAWHFVTLPELDSAEIREHFSGMRRGWGSLPVLVSIGETSWQTSIFPDRRTNSYLLPIKADVRRRERISVGDVVTVRLQVR